LYLFASTEKNELICQKNRGTQRLSVLAAFAA